MPSFTILLLSRTFSKLLSDTVSTIFNSISPETLLTKFPSRIYSESVRYMGMRKMVEDSMRGVQYSPFSRPFLKIVGLTPTVFQLSQNRLHHRCFQKAVLQLWPFNKFSKVEILAPTWKFFYFLNRHFLVHTLMNSSGKLLLMFRAKLLLQPNSGEINSQLSCAFFLNSSKSSITMLIKPISFVLITSWV